MKLEKVRKLQIGDIVVGAGARHPSSLAKGSFWRVIAVEPVSYTGDLPVRVELLAEADQDNPGKSSLTRWPFPGEIARRLPREGEIVEVIDNEYDSIPRGTLTRVIEVIRTTNSGRPLVVLKNKHGARLNFRPEWVRIAKKVKVK